MYEESASPRSFRRDHFTYLTATVSAGQVFVAAWHRIDYRRVYFGFSKNKTINYVRALELVRGRAHTLPCGDGKRGERVNDRQWVDSFARYFGETIKRDSPWINNRNAPDANLRVQLVEEGCNTFFFSMGCIMHSCSIGEFVPQHFLRRHIFFLDAFWGLSRQKCCNPTSTDCSQADMIALTFVRLRRVYNMCSKPVAFCSKPKTAM